jgi:hypothetical protein
MRIVNPNALATIAASRGRATRRAATPPARRGLRQRLNTHMLWAFNPQPELTSRYDREV